MPLTFQSLDEAMAQFEGFGKAGTLATRNNNPGNIIESAFAYSHGAVGASSGFAVFPDVDSGYQATDALVASFAAKGATVASLINAWSPSTAPGNTSIGTQNYINFVTGKLGVTPDTKVSDLANKPAPTSTAASIIDKLGSISTSMMDIVTGKTLASSWGRVGAFIVGLIFIAAGLFLFKPAQQIMISGTKKAISAGAI